MSRYGGKGLAIGAAALGSMLAPGAAAAQSNPDFSISGPRPTSTGRAQGPVDDENPVVRTAPRPAPAPPPVVITPTPTPRPIATTDPRGAPASGVSPPPSGQAQPRPTAQAPRLAPGPQASGAAAGSAPAGEAAPAPSIAPLPTVPGPAASGDFTLPDVTQTTQVQSASTGSFWPWIAGGAGALIAALLGLLWWRRRKPKTLLLEFEHPVAAAPPESAEPQLESQPEPQPAPPAGPAPTAAPASQLAISLEARRMNASLVATTLNYVLRLTNTSEQELSALAVEGDMIAAHGSLPTEQQIAHDNQRLELRHAQVTLAPGESVEFSGDFRLPLASLVPIRAGDAAYFIPLARWRVEASTAGGVPLVQVQTFVVGELPDQPGAALRPFRLDLGPRTYSRIGQRAVG